MRGLGRHAGYAAGQRAEPAAQAREVDMNAVELNGAAILIAAVAHFLLGGLWYSPVLFAKPFTKAMGKTEEEIQAGASPTMYLWAFLGGLVKSAALAVLLDWLDRDVGALEGALIGAFIGLAIHGVADGVNRIFEGRSATLVAISVGYDTVGLAVAGAIIAGMA